MLDIDFFKQVNDTYGHQGGDAILKATADICKHTVRDIDIAALIGGKEFPMYRAKESGRNRERF